MVSLSLLKNDLEASEMVSRILRADSVLNYLMREGRWEELSAEAEKIKSAAGTLATRAGLIAERIK